MSGRKIEYTEDEKAIIVEGICRLYESQNCTLESAAEANGITGRTFRLWKAQNSAFSVRYKKAVKIANDVFWEDVIRPKAQRAIERLIEGEVKQERKVKKELRGNAEDGAEMVVTEEVTTVSEILPNATIAIFAAKGEYKKRFKDRSKSKVEGKVKVENDGKTWFDEIDLDKAEAIIKILNAKSDKQEG